MGDTQKITVTLPNIFGDPVACWFTYLGEVRHHGYVLSSGAWALYGKKGGTPAWYAKVRRYRRRKPTGLLLNSVLRMERGWVGEHGAEPDYGELKRLRSRVQEEA